tara:strand:- start:529 stop:651 length:123 start_codon:yes stop_codon:yes gene_type:complete
MQLNLKKDQKKQRIEKALKKNIKKRKIFLEKLKKKLTISK